ncbi:MAG: xylose isomerase, partial [Lewinella sp.]|nr:xylose isomerase [Lewinella sp.]
MTKTYFPQIDKIAFQGADGKDPMAFTHYEPEHVVMGKPMKDHFRFAVAYWHTLCGTGGDPFGPGPRHLPWERADDPYQRAKDKM